MKLSTNVKSISYLKANAEETQDTLTLLKILALGEKQIKEGKTDSINNVFKRLHDKQSNRA